jgi:twitching motility protein PilT
VPRADGVGRVPAVEVMMSTPYIRDCVENKEKTKFIREQIALGTSQYGMQTFDQSLYQLYKNGLITLDDALRRASNPDEFKLKIQGVQFTADAAREQMEASLQSASDQDLMADDFESELKGESFEDEFGEDLGSSLSSSVADELEIER